jgi:Flp pilus assembly protein TadG
MKHDRTIQRGGKRAGNVILEFAIGSAVLMSLFGGTFQFGYAFYRYNTLESAVNAGARYGSLRVYDSATATPSTAFVAAVKNVVVYGSPSAGTSPVVPGLGTSNVDVSVAFRNGVPDAITVSVSSFQLDAIFKTFTLTNKPKVTYAYQGIYSPY